MTQAIHKTPLADRKIVNALVSAALLSCSGHGTCPPNGKMVTGAACNGSDLQCPYDVASTACDGTPLVVPSSCSCEGGKWVCPDPGTPDCSSADASTSSSSGSATGGSGGMVHPVGSLHDSSCPYIFAWNGSAFEYQTDIEGEVIGLPPTAAVNRGMALFHSSHVKLPTALFDSNNGLELRLRETLPEASYFDQARLLVVDHPEGYEVWSSSAESTYEWDYVEPFKIYTTKDPRVAVSAIDKNGNDVLAYLDELDNSPAPIDQQGLDEYILDFGPIQNPDHVMLLLDAWSKYKVPTTSDLQPYVEAMDSSGQWQKLRNFGPTAGDLKTVVVDLSNLLPPGAQLLKVHLGVWAPGRLLLDRIRLDDSAPVDLQTTYLDPTSAELSYRGTATTTSSTFTSRIVALDDENPDDIAEYSYGAFTRYGDVRELLNSADDRYVIMRHGDQIAITFPGLTPPEAGWVRSVMLEADVFYKVILDTTVLTQVTPLPFHGMLSYPYTAPQDYPMDSAHEAYNQSYNTRVYTASEPN